MKEKALAILRDAIDYNYATKYDKGSGSVDRRLARSQMIATYDTLNQLGLITRDEYIALKEEMHEAALKEYKNS